MRDLELIQSNLPKFEKGKKGIVCIQGRYEGRKRASKPKRWY